jgi:hypothetical protein
MTYGFPAGSCFRIGDALDSGGWFLLPDSWIGAHGSPRRGWLAVGAFPLVPCILYHEPRIRFHESLVRRALVSYQLVRSIG